MRITDLKNQVSSCRLMQLFRILGFLLIAAVNILVLLPESSHFSTIDQFVRQLIAFCISLWSGAGISRFVCHVRIPSCRPSVHRWGLERNHRVLRANPSQPSTPNRSVLWVPRPCVDCYIVLGSPGNEPFGRRTSAGASD